MLFVYQNFCQNFHYHTRTNAKWLVSVFSLSRCDTHMQRFASLSVVWKYWLNSYKTRRKLHFKLSLLASKFMYTFLNSRPHETARMDGSINAVVRKLFSLWMFQYINLMGWNWFKNRQCKWNEKPRNIISNANTTILRETLIVWRI